MFCVLISDVCFNVCCENSKTNILIISPQNPPLVVTFQAQGLEVYINYMPP
jgi:hypothetical protein